MQIKIQTTAGAIVVERDTETEIFTDREFGHDQDLICRAVAEFVRFSLRGLNPSKEGARPRQGLSSG